MAAHLSHCTEALKLGPFRLVNYLNFSPTTVQKERARRAFFSKSLRRDSRLGNAGCLYETTCGQRFGFTRLYEVSVPFVLGTPVMRGSNSTAIRSARAADLKIASATWWLLRP